jgi:hypothetical protein
MANVTIPHSGTEYTANAITLKRGLVTDIITVLLVKPGDALADGSNLDILSKIGPRSGDVILAAGDWQRWCYVKTANEDILRKVDTITIT